MFHGIRPCVLTRSLFATALFATVASAGVRVTSPPKQRPQGSGEFRPTIGVQVGVGLAAYEEVEQHLGGAALLELGVRPSLAATIRVDRSSYSDRGVAFIFPYNVEGELTFAEVGVRVIDYRRPVSGYLDVGIGGFWSSSRLSISGYRTSDDLQGMALGTGIGLTWRPARSPIGCFAEAHVSYFVSDQLADGGDSFLPLRAGLSLIGPGRVLGSADAAPRRRFGFGLRDSTDIPKGRSISTVRGGRGD